MKFMQIEPQAARGVLKESLWDDPDWIAEEKYDGDRRIAQFCGKVVRFTGRRKSVKDGLFVEKTENVPHLSAARGLEVARMAKAGAVPVHLVPAALDGTVLDGEMIYAGDGDGGGRSKFVTAVMGSLPEEAVRKQIEKGWLKYVVFDCLFYKGRDIRGFKFSERQEYVERVVEAEWENPFAVVSENNLDLNMLPREFCEQIIARGGEGVILKHLAHRYGDKAGWVKVKKQATADVVIMGFNDAKETSKKVNGEESITKYAKAGLIGAIQCGQYLKSFPHMEPPIEVATVSGMDDALRAEFTKHPRKYIGKVIEIEHNGREPTGRFRHPRFNRFRDDKAAKDCIYREDES
jgi:ATP-dependent DNA ligase